MQSKNKVSKFHYLVVTPYLLPTTATPHLAVYQLTPPPPPLLAHSQLHQTGKISENSQKHILNYVILSYLCTHQLWPWNVIDTVGQTQLYWSLQDTVIGVILWSSPRVHYILRYLAAATWDLKPIVFKPRKKYAINKICLQVIIFICTFITLEDQNQNHKYSTHICPPYTPP